MLLLQRRRLNVNQTNDGVQAVINDTITPGPNWVVNAFVSYSRWRETHTAVGYGQASASTVGLEDSLFQAPLLPTVAHRRVLPTWQRHLPALCPLLGYRPGQRHPPVRASHTLKFGANFDVGMINVINESAGNFYFSSALTSCDPNGTAPCTALNYGSNVTGNSVASMLLGTASGGGQGINIDPAFSQHTYGVYLQDQWRVTTA